MSDRDRHRWLLELAEAEKKPRLLIEEENPPVSWEREQCVICDKRTAQWLLPENAPLCDQSCLELYLKDPSVWDPRELHARPVPRLVVDEGKVVAKPPKPVKKKPRRRKKPGRWEPSDEYIAEAQARITKRRKKSE